MNGKKIEAAHGFAEHAEERTSLPHRVLNILNEPLVTSVKTENRVWVAAAHGNASLIVTAETHAFLFDGFSLISDMFCNTPELWDTPLCPRGHSTEMQVLSACFY